MDSFSYTITSSDNFEGSSTYVANHAVLVNVNLTLPLNYRFFKCKVKNFFINPASFTTGSTAGRYVNLVSPNFSNNGLYITGNRSNQLIASCDLNSGANTNVNNVFYVENYSGKYITFLLQDEFLFNIPYSRLNQNTFNTTWILTLEFTPIDEDHNNKHNLRNGL